MNNSYEQAREIGETIRAAVDQYNSAANRANNIMLNAEDEFQASLNVLVGSDVEFSWQTVTEASDVNYEPERLVPRIRIEFLRVSI